MRGEMVLRDAWVCDGGEERYSKISFALAAHSNLHFQSMKLVLPLSLRSSLTWSILESVMSGGLGLSLGSDCMLKQQ